MRICIPAVAQIVQKLLLVLFVVVEWLAGMELHTCDLSSVL
jgi:hypothetical protein